MRRFDTLVGLDQSMERDAAARTDQKSQPVFRIFRPDWIVLAAASLVFLVSIGSPPHLMDDVDAVQAQAARNMLASGDWVTARLDGVAYLEKSPLNYWMIAVAYRIFGVHDWAARFPHALAVVLLCWITYRFGRWAFGETAGLYAGIALSTSVGLFLFTRILIPDATLTLTITGAIWACLRLLEPDTESGKVWLPWSILLGICLGAGLLLKGLIAAVFPVTAALVYMAVTRSLFSWTAWRRLHLGLAIAVALAIAFPWYAMATLRNPPYFVFTLHSGPGEYHGFFWFYFFNEHLLRFLGLRYPRDYDTVPRFWFWILNLVWIFPVVFLFTLCADPRLQADFSRRQNKVDGTLLDRRRNVVLHILDDAGILFDADLSRAGVARRVGSQRRRSLGAGGNVCPSRRIGDLVYRAFILTRFSVARCRARRYLTGADATS